MSVRQTKCPCCGSTDLEKVEANSKVDNIGRQDWKITCNACGNTFIHKILVERKRRVRY